MPSTHDASALLAFAEPLLDGRRVLVVGDSSDALAERLVDMGARVVHVYDPSPERALAAAPTTSIRNVSVRTLPDGDFEVRDGAFDVAIVPDLALVPEPEALVVRLRRVLGDAGVAMISAANGGPHQRFDYYQLFDLLALQWNDVRMVARVGFHGVAFAELGSEEIDEGVAVHTDLAGTPGEPGPDKDGKDGKDGKAKDRAKGLGLPAARPHAYLLPFAGEPLSGEGALGGLRLQAVPSYGLQLGTTF